MDTQFKKGLLELCLLMQLVNKDMYGYEIMKIIKDNFPDVYDGSIYTILRRINSLGYTETYMMDIPSGGPPRKYYRVTTKGKKYTINMQNEWNDLSEKVKKLQIK